MTIRHLKIFITVYQKGSITKAASTLNMTQPTVTRAIQELEDHYSRQLFERIHRKLYVTEAGKHLYQQAVHVVSSITQMEENMADWDETGVLRIGAGTTLGCILLPVLLSEFRRIHPQLTLHSTVTDKLKLQEKLLHNELDFALIEGRVDSTPLKKEFLGRDEMVLILPADHPLCKKKTLTVQDIASHPIVISERGSASRTFMENLFSIHAIQLQPVMESGSIPAVIQAVRAGIGVSLIPQKMLSLYGGRDAIKQRNLPYEVLVRNNYLVWHESKYLGRSSHEFIELTKRCCANVLT